MKNVEKEMEDAYEPEETIHKARTIEHLLKRGMFPYNQASSSILPEFGAIFVLLRAEINVLKNEVKRLRGQVAKRATKKGAVK